MNNKYKEILRLNDITPETQGWALLYVEAERPIPETWRNEFYDELCSPDDLYRTTLEQSIRYFGVRWSK